jgi:hypothetical protein
MTTNDDPLARRAFFVAFEGMGVLDLTGPPWCEAIVLVSPTDAQRTSIAKTVNGIAVRILQRADLVAMAMRINDTHTLRR